MEIKQIKINFCVTEQVKRFVYIYLIATEQGCCLIDAGVAGSEETIEEEIIKSGHRPDDVRAVFLTHAHPDHIGCAHYFREKYGAKIYASAGERPWIEDIDLQYAERPIPNFYHLAGQSVRVDAVVRDQDRICLTDDLCIEVVSTPGHSVDGVSYRIADNLFIGDAVPVRGDIPIFVDVEKTRNSLEVLEHMTGIRMFYPAWDETYTPEMMRHKLADAKAMVDMLEEAVHNEDHGTDTKALVDLVCEKLRMPMLKANPLFARTVECCRRKNKSCYFLVDTYIDEDSGRGRYDEYIREVKPIVESFGGEYLIRTERVISLHSGRTPQRVIAIRFPSRQALDDCFSSKEYKDIMNKRIDSVDARALIVE